MSDKLWIVLAVAVVAMAGLWVALPLLGQQPSSLIGLYDVNGQPLFVFPGPEGMVAGFPDGSVRGIMPVNKKTFSYGPAIGVVEPEQGTLSLEQNGDLDWSPAGSDNFTASRIDLIETPVQFRNENVTLSGTLILPPGEGPFPAVVWLHGSGEETRHGSLPFAYYFAYHGIASLVYDKRGVGKSSADSWRTSFENYAKDALAGVELLNEDARIHGDLIGLFGPSQGGWIAPLAATMSDKVAFVMIQSGNAINPVKTTQYWAQELLKARTDLSDDEIVEALAFRQLKFDLLIHNEGSGTYDASLTEAQTKRWFQYVGDALPQAEFWVPNGAYDPIPALEQLTAPIFIAFGEHDKYTPVAENLPIMESIFADHPNATIRVFPNANHGIFETLTGKRLDDEFPELKRIAPGYFEAMVAWVLALVESMRDI
jgi:pimeloyl-ACP methyl ester carboxylesterase